MGARRIIFSFSPRPSAPTPAPTARCAKPEVRCTDAFVSNGGAGPRADNALSSFVSHLSPPIHPEVDAPGITHFGWRVVVWSAPADHFFLTAPPSLPFAAPMQPRPVSFDARYTRPVVGCTDAFVSNREPGHGGGAMAGEEHCDLHLVTCPTQIHLAPSSYVPS